MAPAPRVRVWHARVVRWLCPHCHRFLAEISDNTFSTPSGVFGHLPAVITCPNCGTRSARGSAHQECCDNAH